MSDLIKYNAILPKDDDYHLWYDSLKGWRLNIRGVGNCGFNEEAEILFEIERERIIEEIYGNKEAFEYLVKPEFKGLFVSSLVELIDGQTNEKLA